MVNIETLTVSVKYRVCLGNLEVPEKVKQQLIEAQERGHEIDPSYCTKYPEAAEWLSDNIRERDCMDWECEVDDCVG